MRITIGEKEIGDNVVVTLPGGEQLGLITAIDIAIRMGSLPRAKIEVAIPAADIECEGDIFTTTLPDGKRYRLVEVDHAN